MEESVLTTIKKMLGIAEDYTDFDTDIIVHINSALMSLHQVGIGPDSGLIVVDKAMPWSAFHLHRYNFEAIKSYIYLKTRIAFDPPVNSFVVDAMNKQAEEYLWRLNVEAEGSMLNDAESEPSVH